MSMLREVYGHFWELGPSLVGLENCESLFTHLRNKEVFAGKFLVQHFLAAQQASEVQALDIAY